MKAENEINARNALIEILETVVGAKYECESCPDEETSTEKKPDFILGSTCAGATKIAVEHTVVPSFEQQIDYVRSFYERAEEISRLCEGKIPVDRWYYITAPHELITSLTDKKRQRAFDESLANWIIQQAPQLQMDHAPKQNSYERYKITLTCGGTYPEWNGRVGRIPERPRDAVSLQKQAFDKAIEHGLDKLTKYKRNPSGSFKTVLLLEDIAGLPHERITEGLTSSEKNKIDESIDYIVVLQSNNNQMIVGYVWKESEAWHSFIPADRRFNLHNEGRDKGAVPAVCAPREPLPGRPPFTKPPAQTPDTSGSAQNPRDST